MRPAALVSIGTECSRRERIQSGDTPRRCRAAAWRREHHDPFLSRRDIEVIVAEPPAACINCDCERKLVRRYS